MSSITSIAGASSAINPYLNDLTALANVVQTNFGQTIKDFQSIGNALQSGNIKNAQSAFASFQKDFPADLQTVATQLFGKNSQATADFQSLTTAIKSGDLTGAQKAFTALQGDFHAAASGSSTGTSGSGFSSTLNNILSGFGITPV